MCASSFIKKNWRLVILPSYPLCLLTRLFPTTYIYLFFILIILLFVFFHLFILFIYLFNNNRTNEQSLDIFIWISNLLWYPHRFCLIIYCMTNSTLVIIIHFSLAYISQVLSSLTEFFVRTFSCTSFVLSFFLITSPWTFFCTPPFYTSCFMHPRLLLKQDRSCVVRNRSRLYSI